MKIAILAGNILDGIIISQRILFAGKDVKAIIYERGKVTFKARVKRIIFFLRGIIKYTNYRAMKCYKKDLIVMEEININSDGALDILRAIKPDLIVVIGTRKIKKDIYTQSKLGAINMHSGVLPYYRGADTEFWALVNGEREKIGVSINFIGEKLDMGDIILTAGQEVSAVDNHKTLRMKNIILGAAKMVEAINLVESGNYKRIKQDEHLGKTYKSATREELDKFYDKRFRSF